MSSGQPFELCRYVVEAGMVAMQESTKMLASRVE